MIILQITVYKSLIKSLRINRSIRIDNKNSQKLSLCLMLILQQKMQTSGGGCLKIRTHADKGGGKNKQEFADVLCGWPHRSLKTK